MKEFINEKVNIIVATNSGSGTGSSESRNTITNNTINIRGTIKSIDEQFIILEEVQLIELPQYVQGFGAEQLGTICYNYSKTAVNINNIITISIV